MIWNAVFLFVLFLVSPPASQQGMAAAPAFPLALFTLPAQQSLQDLIWPLTAPSSWSAVQGVEIGIAVGVGLSLALVIYRSAFPKLDIVGRLPNSNIYRCGAPLERSASSCVHLFACMRALHCLAFCLQGLDKARPCGRVLCCFLHCRHRLHRAWLGFYVQRADLSMPFHFASTKLSQC